MTFEEILTILAVALACGLWVFTQRNAKSGSCGGCQGCTGQGCANKDSSGGH